MEQNETLVDFWEDALAAPGEFTGDARLKASSWDT